MTNEGQSIYDWLQFQPQSYWVILAFSHKDWLRVGKDALSLKGHLVRQRHSFVLVGFPSHYRGLIKVNS